MTYLLFSSAVEYAVDTENLSLSAIRTIRVLRPLRAINRIPSKYLILFTCSKYNLHAKYVEICRFKYATGSVLYSEQ